MHAVLILWDDFAQPWVVHCLQVALDREWYDQEEGGAQIDETHNPFLGDQKLFQKKEAEMQQKMKRRDGSTMTLAQSKRQNEFQKDMNAWEENRMLTSGVVRMREVSPAVWFIFVIYSQGRYCFAIGVECSWAQPGIAQSLTCVVAGLVP